ncbi:MAG: Uma2 family endonuclease [Anaerolineae bacterium]
MLSRIKRVPAGDRMTVAGFFESAPEDRKAELIDGVLVMPSPASTSHELLQGFLLAVLRIYVHAGGLGAVLGSRTALDLGIEYQAYEPDILFVRRDRADIIHEQGVAGAPDLVIEILSRGTMSVDRTVKRQVYNQAGVGELWLIDPAGARGSRFYQRTAGGEMAEVALVDGVLRSTTVEGFFVKEEWLWPPEDRQHDELVALRELGVLG